MMPLDGRHYTITFAHARGGAWIEATTVEELVGATIAMKCHTCEALLPSNTRANMLRAAAHYCNDTRAPSPEQALRLCQMADALDTSKA